MFIGTVLLACESSFAEEKNGTVKIKLTFSVTMDGLSIYITGLE